MWITDTLSSIRKAGRDDRGFTIIELSVGGLLASILLTIMAVFLISSMKTAAFTQGQSETINNVRNAVQSIDKEVRGAYSITWAPNGECSAYPAGSCITLGTESPDATSKTVRYTRVDTELRRELFNSGTLTWGPARPVIERVANAVDQPVFDCDTEVTLLRLIVDLHIEPTPVSNPNFHIQTSIRPRNFPSVAVCT